MKPHKMFNKACHTRYPAGFCRVLIPCLIALQTGCAPTAATTKLQHSDHVLVDKIWHVKQQSFIDKSGLMAESQQSEYLLIGERHDNPVHHRHQTWFIEQLSQKPRRVSVAFEMIDNNQGLRLAQQKINSVDQLIRELNRSKNNWNYEQRYRSLFEKVLATDYKIHSANLSSQQLMQTVRQGEEKLPTAFKTMLEKTSLSEEQDNALQVEINQSHCDMLGKEATARMALAQRLRDAIMAHSLLKSRASLKVLIAGNGHVRNDRGVALYLESNLQTQPEQPGILSIGLVEVEAGMTDPLAYAENWGNQSLPFDIVWFTPQVKRGDPCEGLKQHFKSKS